MDVISIRGRVDQCILEKHMSKVQINKDIKKNQVSRAKSGDAATINNASAISHAIDAVDAANLAVEIIGDLETFLCTIAALAKSDEPTEAGARAQLCAIQDIARLAVNFASDRSEHYSFVQGNVQKALDTLKTAELASLDAAA